VPVVIDAPGMQDEQSSVMAYDKLRLRKTYPSSVVESRSYRDHIRNDGMVMHSRLEADHLAIKRTAIELVCPRLDRQGLRVMIFTEKESARIGTSAGITSRTCLTRLMNDM